jgi:hypothetical protein
MVSVVPTTIELCQSWSVLSLQQSKSVRFGLCCPYNNLNLSDLVCAVPTTI